MNADRPESVAQLAAGFYSSVGTPPGWSRNPSRNLSYMNQERDEPKMEAMNRRFINEV